MWLLVNNLLVQKVNDMSAADSKMPLGLQPSVQLGNILQDVYVVVQFYPWFKFYFPLFQTHYYTLQYPKAKEKKI